MVLWPGTQRTREKEEAEGKDRMFLHLGLEEVCSLRQSWQQCAHRPSQVPVLLPRANVPRLWQSRAAAEKGKTEAHRAL